MTILIPAITATDHEVVTAAVRSAEAKTSAEIVPVVAMTSGRYDRGEDIAGLWLGLILLALTWWFYPALEQDGHSWAGATASWQLVAYLLSVILGFIGGTILAGRFPALHMLMTPRKQMQEEVWQRSRAVFFDQRIHHTQGASGVMIYLSLFEHQAVILADQLVHEKLGQPFLDELCEELIQHLRKTPDQIGSALSQTINTLGDKLAATLPRESDDINELSDALVVLQ